MAEQNTTAVARATRGANALVARSAAFWSRLRPQQRVLLGIGAVVTLVAVAFAVSVVTGPDYKPLLGGLDPADAQAIVSELSAKKIPYKIGPDGTSILVPANQLDAARLEVASHDAPHSGRIGFEIFDKSSWGQTEFDEKVNYQRALEGELERTIQTIHNVKSARVHLVMPTETVFTNDERDAKASVTLRLKGGTLSKDEVRQIERLVAGSVDLLSPQDVVITDADADRTLGGFDISNQDGDSQNDLLTKRLVATLAPVVGADRIHAIVNVVPETRSSEQNDEKYDPTVSVPLAMQRTEEGNGTNAPGGVPGTSSNVPSAKIAAANATSEAGPISRSESATYGVNKSTRHELDPAGGIRRITAAVVIDDAVDFQMQNGKRVAVKRKRNPDELRMITELTQAAIGFDSSRGDTVSVQNLSFDRPDDSDLPPDTWIEKMKHGVNDSSSLIRYAGLAVILVGIYFILLRPIQKKVMETPIPSPQATIALAEAMQAAALPSSDTSSLAGQRSLALKSELAEYVRSEPDSSTAAIRAWLREGEG